MPVTRAATSHLTYPRNEERALVKGRDTGATIACGAASFVTPSRPRQLRAEAVRLHADLNGACCQYSQRVQKAEGTSLKPFRPERENREAVETEPPGS
jgi:hypothetical protein